METKKIIGADFFSELRSRHVRRRFIVGIFLLCAFTLFGSFFINKLHLNERTISVLEGLFTEAFAGFFIIFCVYLLYLYFIGPEKDFGDITVIRNSDISENIKKLPLNTRNYMFWGRSGSFLRAYTIPKLSEEASEKKQQILIEIVLPNPNNEKLSKLYRRIKASLNEDADNYTLHDEVIATAYACAIHANDNRFLTFSVHYSDYLPSYRIEVSDHVAILTQDNPKLKAIAFGRETEFYELFRSSIRNEAILSKNLLSDLRPFEGAKTPSKFLLCREFEALGSEKWSGVRAQKVADILKKNKHRYKGIPWL